VKANRLFFLLMAGSSTLALLRGFVLAGVLPVDGFGRYAMVFAIGTFAASLLSFGMVERSFKRFPRLCVDGHTAWALNEADRITKKLGLRAILATATCPLILPLMGRTDWLIAAILGAGVALGVGTQSIYISLQRAEGDLTKIGIASLSRALLALLLGASGALAFGWTGALIGEIGGGLLGGLISRYFIRAKIQSKTDVERTNQLPPVAAEQRELWTFLGFLGAAIPLYLDRGVVTTLLGLNATGTYAVLMLFVMGTYTATGIVSQKLGPQLVRMQRSGSRSATQLWLLGQWSFGISAVGFLGMLIAGWLIIDGPLHFYAVRYDIDWAMLLAAAALAALQVTHLSEWFLLAHDEERGVFGATMVLLTSLALAVAIAAHTRQDITGVIWLFAFAKALQLITLSGLALAAARRGERAQIA
jgi:O-antigen/teichoic acid export membrane protein